MDPFNLTGPEFLALYAFVAERESVRESEHKADHDDYRKAA